MINFNSNLKRISTQLSTTLVVLASFTLLSGCQAANSRANFSESLKLDASRYATVEERGMRLRLYGDGEPVVDQLRLTPGEYMIEFMRGPARQHGIALCQVEAGERYRLRGSELVYMPRSGRYIMKGECFKIENK